MILHMLPHNPHPKSVRSQNFSSRKANLLESRPNEKIPWIEFAVLGF